MRRTLAFVLLLGLVGQSSGVAWAGSARAVPRWSDFATVITPLISAITSSRLYADVTGSGERYAAMHAPRPVLLRKPASLDGTKLMRSQHGLQPHFRKGTRQVLVLPPRSELVGRHRRLDPRAMRRSSLTHPLSSILSASQSANAPVLEPLRKLGNLNPIGPASPRRGSSQQGGGIKPMTATSATTGIEHWWTYEERAIPGIGKAMLNVGTGNFIVSAMDVDQPERGIDLAFNRVYNSQSLHDIAPDGVHGDDGGEAAIFGNKWTNNFDTNIVYSGPQNGNTITVYDIDGAACTYTSNGDGTWQPCTGEYATLAPASGNCTYTLTKPSGTVYVYQNDGGLQINCGPANAFAGHLVEIIGRNINNYITLQYSYDNSGIKNSEHVTEIDAIHSNGDQLTMTFGPIPGTSYNELRSIVRPDLAVLNYWYGTNGNLLEVDKPGNNSATGIPSSPNSGLPIETGDVPETYSYAINIMNEACGPRCTVSMWSNPNSNYPTDGSALLFGVTSINNVEKLTSWQVQGVLNFTPPDGTQTPLQSNLPPSPGTVYTADFDYGQMGNCSQDVDGPTTMCDSDGHARAWTTDGQDRVSLTQDWPNDGKVITNGQQWDTNNNLVETIDANMNVTQYGYDTAGLSQGGNVVEMQLPMVTDVPPPATSITPLSYYSYDQYNNIIAYCDPVYNQTNGNSWQPPSDALCPSGSQSAPAKFKYYTNDANEPFGCLTQITKPSGYQKNITYGSAGSCSNWGLPTLVQGQSMAQPDGTNRTPTQDFLYSSTGNLSGYDRGQDNSGTINLVDSWSLHYDASNRLTQRDENEVTNNGSPTLHHFTCNYPDGSLFYTETPSQHANDNGQTCPTTQTMLGGGVTAPPYATSYQYDTDGDQLQITDHKTNTANTTRKFYDGLDRLVEVVMPQDQQHDCYNFSWMTRYDYDLSSEGSNANLSIGSVQGLVAYGNLYKTQEYIPQDNAFDVTHCGAVNSKAWTDVRGASFDAADRAINKYEVSYGSAPYVLNTYDGVNEIGLLTQTGNASQQTISYYYDNIARVKEIDFNGASEESNRQYTYDADGRTTSRGNIAYTYDVDGNITQESDSPNETNAATVTYANYADGMRHYLSVTGGINQSHIFAYSYRVDGHLDTQKVHWGTVTGTFTWSYTAMGRELSETDPLSNTQVTTHYWITNQDHTGTTTYGNKQYQYDSYGRVSQLQYPQGYLADNYHYDSDDELWGYKYSEEQPDDEGTIDDAFKRNLVLTARGEVLSDRGCDGGTECAGQDYAQSANGTLIDPAGGAAGTNPATSIDARSGMTLSNTYRPTQDAWSPGQYGGINAPYTYDASGRQVKDKLTITTQGAPFPGPFTYNRTYDAENHLLQADTGDACNPNNNGGCEFVTSNLSYGADGQLRGVCQQVQYNEQNCDQNIDLHWDGSTLLFTAVTFPNGTGLKTLYVGKAATLGQNGTFVVADRNQSGVAESWHGAGSFGAWYNYSFSITGQGRFGFPAAYQENWGSCFGSAEGECIQPPMPPQGPSGLWIDYSRADGYGYGPYAVQGVRSYDSTSQQWLTPDAYAGDVDNPISQKPFVWNGNNPLAWSDPSGYDPWPDSVENFFDTEPAIPPGFEGIAGGGYRLDGSDILVASQGSAGSTISASDQSGGYIFGDQLGPNQLVNIPSEEREFEIKGSEETDYVYHASDAFGDDPSGYIFTITEHISGYFQGAEQTSRDVPVNAFGNIGDEVGSGGPFRNGNYTLTQTFTEAISSGGFVFTGGSVSTVFIHTFSVVSGYVTNIQFGVQAP